MILIRSAFIILSLVFTFGCTSTTIKPVKSTMEIKHVCIQDGKLSCFDGAMMNAIRDGFENHGITTQIYSDNLPSECEYYLSYM